MKVTLLLFLFLVLISSCHNSTSPNFDNEEFGIYLLKDSSLSTYDAKKYPVESYQLQDKPIINLDDIIKYDWENQIITLTTEANEKFKNIESKIKSIYGLPFIVVAENQKIYLGNIYPMYSSFYHFDLPSINVAPFTKFRIIKVSKNDIEDKRIDERIYNVLKLYNKII